MKKIFFLFFTVLLVFASINAEAQSVSVGVTIINRIKPSKELTNSQDAIVSNDVLKDGKVVIAAGTPVTLNVVSEKRRGVGKPASITITPISTIDVNGQIVPLSGEPQNATGKNRKGAAVGCGVTFGILLFPVGLLFLCIKGGHAAIPSGTQIICQGTLN